VCVVASGLLIFLQVYVHLLGMSVVPAGAPGGERRSVHNGLFGHS